MTVTAWEQKKTRAPRLFNEDRALWSKYWQGGYESSAFQSAYGEHLYQCEVANSRPFLEDLPDDARILSLGTGRGQVERALFGDRPIISSDLVADPLHEAPGYGVACDVRALPFPDAVFDAVVSYGNASAGSYAMSAPELARVTKPGAVVVMDFSNHLNAYDFIRHNHWRRLRSHLIYRHSGHGRYHHFGRFGIRKFYERHGFRLLAIRSCVAAPPLKSWLSPPAYRAWERMLSPLRPLLARLFIVALKRL